MSVPVDLARLHDAIAGLQRAPYLLTVGEDGRPHCVACPSRWVDDERLELEVGHRTLANASARPSVSLVWPPDDADGHSLIVDGEVVGAVRTDSGGDLVRVRPSRAVLHRPATGRPAAGTPTEGAREEEGCTAECEPITERPPS